MKKGLIFVFSLLMILVVPVYAGEPTDMIKQTTDKIIAIVSDPALKAPEMEKRRRRLIREAIDERFDWEEFSRRSLARYWRQRTP